MKPFWSKRKQVNLENPFEVLISKIFIVVLFLYFFQLSKSFTGLSAASHCFYTGVEEELMQGSDRMIAPVVW